MIIQWEWSKFPYCSYSCLLLCCVMPLPPGAAQEGGNSKIKSSYTLSAFQSAYCFWIRAVKHWGEEDSMDSQPWLCIRETVFHSQWPRCTLYPRQSEFLGIKIGINNFLSLGRNSKFAAPFQVIVIKQLLVPECNHKQSMAKKVGVESGYQESCKFSA